MRIHFLSEYESPLAYNGSESLTSFTRSMPKGPFPTPSRCQCLFSSFVFTQMPNLPPSATKSETKQQLNRVNKLAPTLTLSYLHMLLLC